MPPSPRERLNDLTAAQHNHFTTAQAAACGLSRRVIARMLANGETVRVHFGVYRMASAPVTWPGRLMAAVLAAAPSPLQEAVERHDGVAASHAWAAKLHTADRVFVPESPEVTVTDGHTLAIPGVTVHRTRSLESCDITMVDGIPVTSGARTTIDLAARLDEAAVMALTDDMICMRRATRRWMHERAAKLSHGRRHVDVIVRITAPDAEAEFWSWLERTFHTAVVTGHGLPPPAYNVPLYDRRGRIGIADACWEGTVTVVVELDGLRFHLLSRQRARDTDKHNRYATSGRIPLRFSYEDVVHDPGRVASVIRDALELAQGGETGRCVG